MAKFGVPTPADIWAATTRALTDYASVWTQAARTLTNPSGVFSDAARTLTALDLTALGNLSIYDSIYPVTNVASAAGADTYGSWTEISADIGAGKKLVAVMVMFGAGGNRSWEVEVGEGAAPNEAAVARVHGNIAQVSAAGHIWPVVYPVLIPLTDGARISARAKNTLAAASTYQVGILVA